MNEKPLTPEEIERRQKIEHARFVEQVNLQQTLKSLRHLVESALEGEHPEFLKAKKICEVAEQLKRALGTKVSDFDGADFVCNEEDVQPPGAVRFGQVGGMQDLFRMLSGLLDHQTSRRALADEALAREYGAQELETLLKIVPMTDGEQKQRLEARIEVLTRALDPKEGSDGLVHPDVLGGHQAAGEGQEHLGPTVRSDARRVEGAPGDPLREEPAQ